MINSEGVKEKELSARSIIYGALITLALIFAIVCVYILAVMVKFVIMVLGPVIFSIVTTGVVLTILLGAVQLVKKKRMKGKDEHDDT